MYFESRVHAGVVLASQLYDQYRYENTAVVSLSEGGVLVGEQIASYLHSVLTMLLIEDIPVPGEDQLFGGVSQGGDFTYNSTFSAGEVDEYTSEFHGYLAEKKREAFQKINRLLGEGGYVDHAMLRDRNIILVSDGFEDVSDVDVAMEFLKPVRYHKLIIAAPIATVSAVDRLHVIADELHILDVKQNYISTDHYYDQNSLPSHEEILQKINSIVLHWR